MKKVKQKNKANPKVSFIKEHKQFYKGLPIAQKWLVYIELCKLFNVDPYNRLVMRTLESFLL